MALGALLLPLPGRVIAAKDAAAASSLSAASSNTLSTPSSSTPSSISPLLRDMNVLILALDDLDLSLPARPPAAPVPALAGDTSPVIPAIPEAKSESSPAPGALPEPNVQPRVEDPVRVEPVIPGAIVPAGFLQPAVIMRAHARMRADEKLEKFKPDPEPPSEYSLPPDDTKRTGSQPEPERQSAGNNTGVVIASPDGAPVSSIQVPSLRSPSLTAASANDSAPGPSLLTAAPLRRALLSYGMREENVLNTGPRGPVITRALGSSLLSEQVLTSLKASMGSIAAAQRVAAARTTTADAADSSQLSSEIVQTAIRPASRIGQALNYRAVIVLSVTPSSVRVTPSATPAAPASAIAAESTGSSTVTPAAPPQLLTAVEPGRPKTAAKAPTTRKAPVSSTSLTTGKTNPRQAAECTLVLVDSLRDSGQILSFHVEAETERGLYEEAARTSAAAIAAKLEKWNPGTPADRLQLVERYMKAGREAIAQRKFDVARDYLERVAAVDPSRAEGYLMLGDALRETDPSASAEAYQKALEVNARDGAAWARVAVALTQGEIPDWPKALKMANRALELKYESAELRLAMATAEYGRAALFREHDRITRAEDTELAARRHLDRALELAADNPELSLQATRLMARQLVENRRYREAAQTLDRLALQYPESAEIQTLYATALTGLGNRDEDAFVAWSRVWKLAGLQSVPLDIARYTQLANGFDRHVAGLARSASQLSSGVATGTVLREQALLLLQRLRQDMATAETAINTIQPPPGRIGTAHYSRVLAVDLLNQALENHQIFIETGRDVYLTRASDLYRQSLAHLNSARVGHN